MQNNPTPHGKGLLRSIDWFTVLLYVILICLGWMSVCGATYDFEQAGNFFDFSTRSGMQIVWMGTSLVLALFLLMTDDRLIESLSYIIYLLFVVLLFVTPFLAHDIKGSLSWIKVGSFSVQPAEFAKFATALCVAKVMSTNGFSVMRRRDFLIAGAVILLPVAAILLQKETGSALVYLSFFLMLYREGMPGCVLFTGLSAIVYFVVGVRFAEQPMWTGAPVMLGPYLVLLLITLSVGGMVWMYTKRRDVAMVLLSGVGVMAIATLFSRFVIPFDVVWVQLGVSALGILYLLYHALRDRMMSYLYISLFALGAIALHYSAGFVMTDVLQPHQQTRIRVLLGLEDDPRDAGYNVIQAKIAIGSGGLRGKGFLNGTQTKLKYVPEQDTDFIFCTVGEEEGFLGCTLVLALYLALILRLIHLAERQPYTFGRVYGYCVMSIFLFHLFINVGMVLGLTPVIGIPLPFFSYGGSSLWGFTILLFIFLRIDAGRYRMQR
ncbi:MAG: rod shape-determining protein RodA [Bacteroidaceae bacterium]|nr:rod shape-determining protein RodA [Bacteroidaceae bacterium]